jgi:hypothetical protein
VITEPTGSRPFPLSLSVIIGLLAAYREFLGLWRDFCVAVTVGAVLRLRPGPAAAARPARLARPAAFVPKFERPRAGCFHDHEGSAAYQLFFLHQRKILRDHRRGDAAQRATRAPGGTPARPASLPPTATGHRIRGRAIPHDR